MHSCRRRRSHHLESQSTKRALVAGNGPGCLEELVAVSDASHASDCQSDELCDRSKKVRSCDDNFMLDNISALLNSGCSVMLACKEVGISRTTYYRLTKCNFDSKTPSTYRRFLEVAKKSSPCSAESRSPQSTLKQKPPVPNVHASGAHPSSLLKNCVNNTDSELPGLTPSNVSLLPPRLRNHFMSVMHQKVKEHVSGRKMWSNMDVAERASLKQLAEDIVNQPTCISEPITFVWNGEPATKLFTTYEFIRPCCLHLIIRYLRDRCYRGGRSVNHAAITHSSSRATSPDSSVSGEFGSIFGNIDQPEVDYLQEQSLSSLASTQKLTISQRSSPNLETSPYRGPLDHRSSKQDRRGRLAEQHDCSSLRDACPALSSSSAFDGAWALDADESYFSVSL